MMMNQYGLFISISLNYKNDSSKSVHNLSYKQNSTIINTIKNDVIYEQTQRSDVYWYNSLLAIIILITISGNLLVVLAVMKNKILQNTTNYFLMSLAIADFLVAIIVMPLNMITEILGFFPFGHLICNLWITSDVLLCTSSIWHMCIISMDRFFTIRFPFKYGRNKTHKYMLLKIILVWFISLMLCSPIFIIGVQNPTYVFNYDTNACALEHPQFKIYGSIFAFYIPLLIIAITYLFTMNSLKHLMKTKEKADLTDDQQQQIKWSLQNVYESNFNCFKTRKNDDSKNDTKKTDDKPANNANKYSFDLSSNKLNSCLTNLTHVSNPSKLSIVSRDSKSTFSSQTRVLAAHHDVTHVQQQQQQTGNLLDVASYTNSAHICKCMKCSDVNSNRNSSCVFTRFNRRYTTNSQSSNESTNAKTNLKSKRHVSKSLSDIKTASDNKILNLLHARSRHSSLLHITPKKLVPLQQHSTHKRLSSFQMKYKQFCRKLSFQRKTTGSSERFVEFKRLQKTLLHIEKEMDNLLEPLEHASNDDKMNIDVLTPTASTKAKMPPYTYKLYSDPLNHEHMAKTSHSNSVSSYRQKHLLSISRNNSTDSKSTTNLKYTEYQVQTRFFRANNERKAVKVLIIIFVIFVALWTPFFLFNILSAFCTCKFITYNLMSFCTWLGYASSMANPIIYTVFNKSFRKAFIDLLTCKTKYNDDRRRKIYLYNLYLHRHSKLSTNNNNNTAAKENLKAP